MLCNFAQHFLFLENGQLADLNPLLPQGGVAAFLPRGGKHLKFQVAGLVRREGNDLLGTEDAKNPLGLAGKRHAVQRSGKTVAASKGGNRKPLLNPFELQVLTAPTGGIMPQRRHGLRRSQIHQQLGGGAFPLPILGGIVVD